MRIRNVIILFIVLFIMSCSNEKTAHDRKDMEQDDRKGVNVEQQDHDTKKTYTCPMHPEIIRNAPGQCPICGMDLVEKISEGKASGDNNLELLLKPTNTYVLSQVKTIKPKQNKLPVEINTSGKITYDTRGVSVVSARVAGRIEKLYIKYLFQPVEKGQKLMDIYSKELVTEQENYIYLLRSDPENKTLIQTAENRLQLQGLTTEQINELNKTKKPFQSVTIYSPVSGHLHSLTGSSVSSGMTSMNNTSPTELTMKEGMYIQKGQSVFNIYNTKKVWAILSVYSNKINLVKIGQPVKMQLDDEMKFDHIYKVDFIEPEIRAGENTVSVRVYVSNTDNKIKIGSNVKAVIEVGNKSGLFIPSTAVINLGNSRIVFIMDNGLFKAQQVQIGVESNDLIEIVSGLTENDTIAENAQFLMDSESFIKSKIQ